MMRFGSFTLKDYQEEAVRFCLPQPHNGILDDMGTGKTVMGIALDVLRRKQPWPHHKRTLVVTMAGAMVDTWKDHYAAMAPHLKVVTLDPKRRVNSWAAFMSSEADVFIMHWDAVRLMPELTRVNWLHVIGDEIQRIQYRDTAMTKAFKKIRSVGFKLGLSGTPSTGKPEGFWSPVLNWLYPQGPKWATDVEKGYFRSYWKYNDEFIETEEQTYSKTNEDGERALIGYKKTVGPKNEAKLQKIVGVFTIRRKLRDVHKDHPEEVPGVTYFVDLLPEQRRTYNEMRDEMVAWVRKHETDDDIVAPIVAGAAVAKLTRLLQFAAASADVTWELGKDGEQHPKVYLKEPSSKLDRAMELIDILLDEDNKVVVFAVHAQLIRLLNTRLAKKKVDFVSITGDVDQKERITAVKRFQEGSAQVFTGTIAAGGVGITLTAANHLIMLQRDWSPALNQQAISRLDRLGQKLPVQVIDIVSTDTVEVEKNDRAQLKWSWLKRMLGDT